MKIRALLLLSAFQLFSFSAFAASAPTVTYDLTSRATSPTNRNEALSNFTAIGSVTLSGLAGSGDLVAVASGGALSKTNVDLSSKQAGSAALTNLAAGANITNVSHSPLQAGEIAITNGGTGLDRGFKSLTAGTMISFSDEGTNIIITGTGQTGSAALTNIAAGANITNVSHSPLQAGEIAITNGGTGLDRGFKSLTAGTMVSFSDEGTNIIITGTGQTGSAALTNISAGANITNISHSPLQAGEIAITNGGTGLDRGFKSLTAGTMVSFSDEGTNIIITGTGQTGSAALTNLAATKALTNVTQTVITNTGVSLYTVPSGVRWIFVECLGAGAGGGAVDGTGSQSAAGGGGGSGAYCATNIASPAASYIVTVGLRGGGGATPANNGTNGGSTLFTNIMTAAGGNGGVGKVSAAAVSITLGGAGAAEPSGPTIKTGGSPGANGICVSAALAISGGGAGSIYGGGGAAQTAAVGGNATGFGAGGGGAAVITNADRAGGDGSNGIIIVTEYY